MVLAGAATHVTISFIYSSKKIYNKGLQLRNLIALLLTVVLTYYFMDRLWVLVVPISLLHFALTDAYMDLPRQQKYMIDQTSLISSFRLALEFSYYYLLVAKEFTVGTVQFSQTQLLGLIGAAFLLYAVVLFLMKSVSKSQKISALVIPLIGYLATFVLLPVFPSGPIGVAFVAGYHGLTWVFLPFLRKPKPTFNIPTYFMLNFIVFIGFLFFTSPIRSLANEQLFQKQIWIAYSIYVIYHYTTSLILSRDNPRWLQRLLAINRTPTQST